MTITVKCPKCGHEFVIVVVEKTVEKPKRLEATPMTA